MSLIYQTRSFMIIIHCDLISLSNLSFSPHKYAFKICIVWNWVTHLSSNSYSIEFMITHEMSTKSQFLWVRWNWFSVYFQRVRGNVFYFFSNIYKNNFICIKKIAAKTPLQAPWIFDVPISNKVVLWQMVLSLPLLAIADNLKTWCDEVSLNVLRGITWHPTIQEFFWSSNADKLVFLQSYVLLTYSSAISSRSVCTGS